MSEKSSVGTLVSRPTGSVSLLDTAFQNLPADQREQLLKKALEEKLGLEVEVAKATQRHNNSSIDLQKTVQHVRDLEESTNSDYTVNAKFETASGNMSVSVKKGNHTTIIVITVAIAIAFIIFFGR
jgi:hypothetical protein